MAWWGRRTAVDSDAPDLNRAFDGPSFDGGDPALAEFLGLHGLNDAGVNVSERTALGLTAVYRSVAIIAGAVAGLPLKSYRTDADDQRSQVPSFLDDPGAPYFTPFEFKELVCVHILLHGAAPLLHVYNGAGALAGLFPVHPSMVKPRWLTDKSGAVVGKVFDVTVNGTIITKTEADMTYVMGMSADGLTGLSPLHIARNALGTGIAGDKAAARMFSSGMLIGGLVTADETLVEEDAKTILSGLKAKLTGTQNAGDIAIVNASLKFTPWTMDAESAQFIESRGYQVNEVARLFGVPKVLLAEDGASTWGSGIAELNRGLARYTLMPLTSRIEERLSTLLSSPRHCEFEYKGLLQGSPGDELALLIQQVDAGLLTVDEARGVLNLPPKPLNALPPPLVPTVPPPNLQKEDPA